MSYVVHAALWIAGSALAGLAFRSVINRGEHRQ